MSAANDEGVTALIAAASEGHHAIVDMIVEKTSADVNAQDKDGTTALMAAAVRGHHEVYGTHSYTLARPHALSHAHAPAAPPPCTPSP